MQKTCLYFLCLFSSSLLFSQQNSFFLPTPTKQQQQWQDMEFFLFTHFGPNTFTSKEWGNGNEPEDAFNPSNLDCKQWCKVAKAAGAKGIIITAKHHDGFCLWPSKYSTHTVRESKWKNGKGDVLKELSEACKEYGLKFGVYISPWDRNHPKYGTPEYNDVFVNMMKEIFTNYGTITELWWDGANGEGPNGKKQVYDWKRFEKTVREISPTTLVFSDIGPDIRWAGNENGVAGITNWNYLDTAGFARGLGAPPTDTLNNGNVNGKYWIPAECDVSIRPGWFYHEEENTKVKTPQQLFQLYVKSVGRGANLLLNVPPDKTGRIHANDSTSLVGFKKLLDENFTNEFLKKNAMVNSINDEANSRQRNHLGINYMFKKPVKVNCIVLKEDFKNGQSIKNFNLTISSNGQVLQQLSFTTVGHKRIITFPATEATEITIAVTKSKTIPKFSSVEAYLIEESLIEK
jgi:alpha-L-fucosidase